MSVPEKDFSQRIASLTPEQRRLLELRLKRQQEDDVARPRPLPRLAGATSFPLSFAQQRLWFLAQLEPESTAYNLFETVRLAGRLDAGVLDRAFSEIVRRQESLRTRFEESGGQGSQVVEPPRPFAVERVDLGALPAAERKPEALRLVTRAVRVPFDLRAGGLLRATLFRLDAQHHLLLVVIHHIVSDGWSIGILLAELTALYEAFTRAALSPLPELPLQYADFAVWQRRWMSGGVLAEQLGYWRRRLAGAPPLLELPTDFPRPAVQSFHGGRRPVTVPGDLARELTVLGRREELTPFMVLLAAFEALLGRYTGQADLSIGSPIANRRQVEIEKLVGFFVNTLVLRTDLGGDPEFVELARRVREASLGAFSHQDLPFEKLVDELRPERTLSYSPLFQVMFNLQNARPSRVELTRLTLEPLTVEHGQAQLDLSLSFIESGDGLTGWLEYNSDLFEPETAERLARHFTALLRGIADAPGQRLSELPLLSASERRQLLVEWNETAVSWPGETLLHELFERQAASRPEAWAVGFGAERLSYGELSARSNRLARHLRRWGVGAEVRVGLCVERSAAMVVALLGILKAGGAYVPLDPSHPAERLGLVMADSAVPVLVAEERLLGRLPSSLSAVARVVCLDRDGEAIA
ncbi:MAG TPA: condensation domain-containing protein, partial [Thermoanaerobaculia bacterium]|nr:condensation domain-containing protein [Thermoanaerobaculia bacterium]